MTEIWPILVFFTKIFLDLSIPNFCTFQVSCYRSTKLCLYCQTKQVLVSDNQISIIFHIMTEGSHIAFEIWYALDFDCLVIRVNLQDMFLPLTWILISCFYICHFCWETWVGLLINLYLMQGNDIIFQTNPIRSIASASHPSQCYLNVSSSCGQLMGAPSLSISHRINSHLVYRVYDGFKGRPLSPYSVTAGERFHLLSRRHVKEFRFRIHASLDVASAVDVINDLGLDTLTFLGVTVFVVPVFKTIKASPVSWLYLVGFLKFHC